MVRKAWKILEGEGPIIATAIHAGHELRPRIAQTIRLSSAERLREEDPYSDVLTCVAPTQVLVNRSRFEVDLNRPEEQAIYQQPTDCWGLEVWRNALSSQEIQESLDLHRRFYADLHAILLARIERYGVAVVLDIHTYNHRRGGPDAPPESARNNPEINLGTATMPAFRWDGFVSAFSEGLRQAHCMNRPLDVRENVRFRGGYLPLWVHTTFPRQACAIAIEFKKTFMDEWSGRLNHRMLMNLLGALSEATQRLRRTIMQRSVSPRPLPEGIARSNF